MDFDDEEEEAEEVEEEEEDEDAAAAEEEEEEKEEEDDDDDDDMEVDDPFEEEADEDEEEERKAEASMAVYRTPAAVSEEKGATGGYVKDGHDTAGGYAPRDLHFLLTLNFLWTAPAKPSTWALASSHVRYTHGPLRPTFTA